MIIDLNKPMLPAACIHHENDPVEGCDGCAGALKINLEYIKEHGLDG